MRNCPLSLKKQEVEENERYSDYLIGADFGVAGTAVGFPQYHFTPDTVCSVGPCFAETTDACEFAGAGS